MPGSGAGGLSYRELGCKKGLGSPALLLYPLPSRIPPPCAYLFVEAVFDTQPQLRKIVVKILIKKTLWVFQRYAVAWEGVGYCPSYWKSVGCFATDVYQVFSLPKKRGEKGKMTEKHGERFASEACCSQLPATQRKPSKEKIHLYQIQSILQWGSRFDKSGKPNKFWFLNSFYAVYVPSTLMETDFQQQKFMGWWFNAEYRCTFQACHHILPQALSSVTGQCC